MKIKDDVFGVLSFNYGWTRSYKARLLGREFEMLLMIEAEEDEVVLDSHRELFLYFQNNITSLNGRLVYELTKYIKEELNVEDASEFLNSVEFTSIIFCDPEIYTPITFGLLAECEWEPEHGLGIKFEGDDIEVGFQDILL